MEWIIERNTDNEIIRRRLKGTNITIEREHNLGFGSDTYFNLLFVNGEWYKGYSTIMGSGYTLKDLKEIGENLVR